MNTHNEFFNYHNMEIMVVSKIWQWVKKLKNNTTFEHAQYTLHDLQHFYSRQSEQVSAFKQHLIQKEESVELPYEQCSNSLESHALGIETQPIRSSFYSDNPYLIT